MPRSIVRSIKKRAVFLDALATGMSVSESANSAGVGLRTVYTWRKEDAEFAKDWAEAYAEGVDALETEARRRGATGVEEGIYYQGKRVDVVRKYSDTLLIMLLKARDPERFCERARTAKLMRKWAEEDEANGRGDTVPADAAIAALERIANAKAATA